MKLPSLLLVTAFFTTSLPALRAQTLPDPATKNQCPPVAYVQGMIWNRMSLTSFTLTGSVRSDKTKMRYPIILRTAGHTQEYDFQNQPLQILVKLDPGTSLIEKRSSPGEPWTPVSGAARLQPIFGSDLTYEDLGVDFVNWDDTEALGLDSIKTLKAYVYEATPGPNDHSHLAKVRYWVSALYWAFLRIDGLNAQEQTVKRVEVQDVMQIGKFTVFKEMKVSTMDPTRNDIPLSTTFVDIDGGKEGSDLPK
jgi:hypothetical protein